MNRSIESDGDLSIFGTRQFLTNLQLTFRSASLIFGLSSHAGCIAACWGKAIQESSDWPINMEMTTITGERQKVFNSRTQSPAVGGIKAKLKAGIALLQKNGHRMEVLLVKQANGRWSLPKGKRKTGETIKQTGLRECLEETGREAQALRFVGWGVNSRKGIRLYLWKSEAHRLSAEHGTRWHPRKREILRIAWVSLLEAQLMLKPWQATLLARIMRSATNGPA